MLNLPGGKRLLEFAAILMTNCVVYGDAHIIVKPVDTEVRVDDSTYFNCSISSASAEISWYHYPAGRGTRDKRYVYLKGKIQNPYDERYRIERDNSSGSFSLIVTKAKLQDAGTFVCQNGGTDNSANAEMIVLKSDPVCVTKIDPGGYVGPNDCGLAHDKLELSCAMNYTGNVPPKLQLVKVKNDNSSPVNESLLPCLISRGRIICTYTVDANIELDGSSFICQTKRSKETQYKCSTDVIKIIYAIGNNNTIVKSIGDNVTCSVNTSSANCTYSWLWFDGVYEETVSVNQHLAIKKEGWHRCKATCFFGNIRCPVNKVLVKATSKQTANPWIVVGLGTCLISLGLLCIVVVVETVVIVKLKRKKSPTGLLDGRIHLPEELERLLQERDGLKQERQELKNQIENLQMRTVNNIDEERNGRSRRTNDYVYFPASNQQDSNNVPSRAMADYIEVPERISNTAL